MFDNNFGKCERIFKILSRIIRQKIIYVRIAEISISPATCCYTTLWKLEIQKCYWFWQHPQQTLLTCFSKHFEENSVTFLDYQISQGSVATHCRWGGNFCGVYIRNFLRNQLVKEFWKSIHICQSYYQTSRGVLFWDTVYWRG